MCGCCVSQDQGKLDEAEPLMLRCLAIDEAVYGSQHPEIATDCLNLAGLYQVRAPRDEGGKSSHECVWVVSGEGGGLAVGWLVVAPGERAISTVRISFSAISSITKKTSTQGRLSRSFW